MAKPLAALKYLQDTHLCLRSRSSWGASAAVLSCSIIVGLGSICPHVRGALNLPIRSVLHSDYPLSILSESYSPWSKFLSVPILNDDGHTAFIANGGGQATVVSEAGNTGPEVIARVGQSAPGLPGASITLLRISNMSETGVVSFSGGLEGTGFELSDHGLWSGGGGQNVSLISHDRGQAPGTSGAIFESSAQITRQNSSGQVALAGLLEQDVPRPIDTGIWSNRGENGLVLVVRESDIAPGTNGYRFNGLYSSIALNDNGTIAFSARFLSPDGQAVSDSGIWLNSKGGFENVISTGDDIPGIPNAKNLNVSAKIALNNSSEIAFLASYQVANEQHELEQELGLWAGTNDNLRLVANTQSQVTGLQEQKLDYFSDVLIDGDGLVTFTGLLTGESNTKGIWSESQHGVLELVAASGGIAPGTDGATFERLWGLAKNSSGQIVFAGSLVVTEETPFGPDGELPELALPSGLKHSCLVSHSNNTGIWGQNAGGELKQIVREGQQIDVAPGPPVDLRTISTLDFAGGSGNEDGGPSGFNNLGQLGFFATFTDGTSGIFVSNVFTVPEPSSSSLLAVLFLFRLFRIFKLPNH